MDLSAGCDGREHQIVDLFTTTFTASEGAEEGALIGTLVKSLLSGTPEDDLFVFTAEDAGALVGAVIFSRLRYDQDDRTVFLLSPLAVAPDRQRQGIGQKLVTHGLDALRTAGIDIVVTYGDPAYYGRVGFAPITEDFAPAPLALSQPEGWLGQALTDGAPEPLKGSSTCVAALNNPAVW